MQSYMITCAALVSKEQAAGEVGLVVVLVVVVVVVYVARQ